MKKKLLSMLSVLVLLGTCMMNNAMQEKSELNTFREKVIQPKINEIKKLDREIDKLELEDGAAAEIRDLERHNLGLLNKINQAWDDYFERQDEGATSIGDSALGM